MLIQAARFLSLPPGDLVYHLVVLFAIAAIARMTWGQRQDERLRRWAIAAAWLAAGRLLLILAALLSAARVAPALVTILPPLDRFVEVASLGVLAWACLPALHEPPRARRVLTIGNLILAAIAYAWFAPYWYRLQTSGQSGFFNGTPGDAVWGIWALALATLAMLAAPLRRGPGWAVALVAFGLLAAGQALHLMQPDTGLHAAEWARLGATMAYPLFAAHVLGQIEARVPSSIADWPTLSGADLWPIAEVCRAVQISPSSQALDRVAGTVAQVARADLVAIGLPGDSPGMVKLTAIHNASATLDGDVTFQLDAHPAIKQAIARKLPITCPSEEASNLMPLLKLPSLRPLLIQPLVHERETIGVLLLSRADQNLLEPSDDGFARAAQAAADQLACALGTARKSDLLAHRADVLSASLREQEASAAQAQLTYDAEIARQQIELQNTLIQLSEAQQQAAHHQKRAAEIAALVELQATEPQEHVRRLTAEREQALVQAQALQEQLDQLMERQTALEAAQSVAAATEQPAQVVEPAPMVESAPTVEPAQVNGNHSGVTDEKANGRTEPNHHEVVASMAQELRTPMTSISGYTDLLLSESAGILGAMQRQFLQRVKANIERMNGMLDDLVRATTLDQPLRLQPELVNLSEMIEQAIRGSAAQFRERNINIQLDLAGPLPPIKADRDSLLQIISHLLSNACLSSQPGSEVIVSARMDDDRQHVTASVTDTGGGISPSDQLRVFARRYRADNALIQGLGDTGVGLSMAKTLVEAHGGRIWVNSEPGHGLTITFILEAAQLEPGNAQPTEGIL